MQRSSNGRVDINGPRMKDLFQMYDKIPVNQCATYRDPTAGIWDNTALSDGFFSSKNITIIQNGIRTGVYKRSNGQYTISNQDEDTLKIIMRSIFLQHAANQPTHVNRQIYELNLCGITASLKFMVKRKGTTNISVMLPLCINQWRLLF